MFLDRTLYPLTPHTKAREGRSSSNKSKFGVVLSSEETPFAGKGVGQLRSGLHMNLRRTRMKLY